MAANNIIKVTDIDFDTIKENLKSFLSHQSEFRDYDFESSTIQILLNLLSYNTYYNAFYMNMISNEMFLDSAQQRANVVSRAKMLGYVPTTYRGAKAKINVVVPATNSPAFINVPKNTKFTVSSAGKSYTFVNPTAQIIVVDATTGKYQKDIDVVEGTPLTFSYTVDVQNPVRYVIPNKQVDSTSIEVQVQESQANTTYNVYTQATNLTQISSTSTVYFLQENEDGLLEISFGDGILGKTLTNGNIVNINYRVCSGTDANGLNSFTISSAIDGVSGCTATNVLAAYGGANTESIDSIKYNAPRVFESQNRAVTSEDYKRLIINEYSDVQSVSVWGGEDNNPPTYGKVFISCKPKNGVLLSTTRKSEIVDYLSSRKILAIDPEVVDATYLYVEPITTVRFDPQLTNLTNGQILSRLQNAIIDFEANQLGLFNGRFIHSQFIDKLAKVDRSIVSVDTKVRVQKRFTPTANIATTYSLNFNRPLLSITEGVTLSIAPTSHPGVGFTVTSSSFTYDGYTAYMDDDGFGNVRIYYINSSSARVYLNRSAGTVNYNTGLITLSAVTFQSSAEIQVSVVPKSQDITTIRNQLLLITGASIDLYNDLSGEQVATVASVNTEGGTSSIIETAILNVIY